MRGMPEKSLLPGSLSRLNAAHCEFARIRRSIANYLNSYHIKT